MSGHRPDAGGASEGRHHLHSRVLPPVPPRAAEPRRQQGLSRRRRRDASTDRLRHKTTFSGRVSLPLLPVWWRKGENSMLKTTALFTTALVVLTASPATAHAG